MVAGQLSCKGDEVLLNFQSIGTVAQERGQTGPYAKAAAPFTEGAPGGNSLASEELQRPEKENGITGEKARNPAVTVGGEELIEPQVSVFDQGRDRGRKFVLGKMQGDLLQSHGRHSGRVGASCRYVAPNSSTQY